MRGVKVADMWQIGCVGGAEDGGGIVLRAGALSGGSWPLVGVSLSEVQPEERMGFSPSLSGCCPDCFSGVESWSALGCIFVRLWKQRRMAWQMQSMFAMGRGLSCASKDFCRFTE
jgi:hypothetical protein